MYWITRFILSAVFFIFVLTSNINAREIEITGYASLIGTYTDEKDVTYLNEFAQNYIDFTHHSHIGLQFNTEIIKNLELSLTLLSEGQEDYQTRATWFYATYAISKDTSFRFGRLKLPFYLVSNYIDIGNAYPWVTPPDEVYNTNIINSPEGVEYVYETDFYNSVLSFNTYIGSDRSSEYLAPSFIDDSTVNTNNKYATGDKIKYESHELFGAAINIASEHITFQITHNQTVIASHELNITKSRVSLGSFGLILDYDQFVLYSEFTHRDSEASLQSIFPDQNSKYITLGYKISKYMPYITYATIDKGKTKSKYSLVQQTSTIGLRYDVNPKMAIKIQASKIKPDYSDGNTGRYGLFDKALTADKEPTVVSMSVDILF